MVMLYDFLIFLPASVCLMYSLMLAFRVRKTSAQWILMLMLFFTAVYTLGDAIYVMPDGQYETNVVIDILSALTTPMLPVLAVILMSTLLERRLPVRALIAVVIVEVVYASMLVVCVLLTGLQDLAALQEALVRENRTFDILEGLGGPQTLPVGFQTTVFCLYLILTRPVFYFVIASGIAAVLIYTVVRIVVGKTKPWQFMRFCFRGGSITTFYLLGICFWLFGLLGVIRIVAGLDMFRNHAASALLFSMVEAGVFWAMGALSLLMPRASFCLRDVIKPMAVGKKVRSAQARRQTADSVALASDEEVDEDSAADAAALLPDDAPKMLAALRRLMEDDQLFLNPNLTVEDVAAELGSNRVYISRLVNQMMHVSFREYVNRLRIAYSKNYMIAHPDYTQEAVALACGYQDAASFNRKFRQMANTTPREWYYNTITEQQSAK